MQDFVFAILSEFLQIWYYVLFFSATTVQIPSGEGWLGHRARARLIRWPIESKNIYAHLIDGVEGGEGVFVYGSLRSIFGENSLVHLVACTFSFTNTIIVFGAGYNTLPCRNFTFPLFSRL